MRATSHNRLVRSQLDAGNRERARFVDAQLELRRYKSGTPVARFGGRWDRLTKRYIGDAPRSRVLELHGAQIEVVETFDTWLVDHLQGGAEDVSDRVRELVEADLEIDASGIVGLAELIMVGGRRSGKSLLLEIVLNAYALVVPGAIVWTVTPGEQFHEEPRNIVEELLPRDWYRYFADPHFRFDLCNGSRHFLRSGARAPSLKKGKANLVGVNEGQQITEASYRNARGATVDAGGLTLVAANPPTVGDVGTWVLDGAIDIEKGQRPGAKFFFIDPMKNPHIDHRALLALKSSMTAHDWETQVRGRLLEAPGAVLYTWDRTVNERPAPDFGRVTREFLTAHEGDRAEWRHLVVVDVQLYPWIAAGIFDVYRDPNDAKNPKAGLLWMVDEVALAQGDEVDTCDELKRRGIDPERTLVVMDASCRWQQARRDPMTQRPQFTGKGSMDIFRGCGFRHVVPPDRAMKGNPDVIERIRATNAAIRTSDGVAHLFVDDSRCPNAIESARKWRMHRGKPSRTQRSAHFGDVFGYAVWRFFPRRGKGQDVVIDRLRGRDRGALADVGDGFYA